MNAQLGFCKPKKIMLQKAFRKRFIENNISTLLFSLLFFALVQAKYIEKAIITNKIFQTIGNTKFGGVKFGLLFMYQSLFV